MTNFAVQSVAGPVVSSLASKDKGSFGNRMNCAGAQMKNNLVTGLQGAAVAGAAIGATAAAVKYNNFGTAVARTFDKTANALGKLAGTKDLAGKINKKLAKLISKGVTKDNANLNPETLKSLTKGLKASKAGLLISAITVPVLGYIARKHSYKMGQIDQKYTDKAKLEKNI